MYERFFIKNLTLIIDSCYAKQHRCGIFVAEMMENETKVQSTETIVREGFRCDAPFELVSIIFYKYCATLLLCVTSLIDLKLFVIK